VLKSVKIFLTGDPSDINMVQNVWPTLGGANRPELNGGYDISFDFGRTYTRFDSTHGLESDSTTWIVLPSESIGLQGQDGVLTAFDTAHMLVRVVVPPGDIEYKSFDIRLAMDFDIL
jgi:hypothetical protein